jgi:hypothetical protein
MLPVKAPQRASLDAHYVGECWNGNPMTQYTFYMRSYAMTSHKKSQDLKTC